METKGLAAREAYPEGLLVMLELRDVAATAEKHSVRGVGIVLMTVPGIRHRTVRFGRLLDADGTRETSAHQRQLSGSCQRGDQYSSGSCMAVARVLTSI